MKKWIKKKLKNLILSVFGEEEILTVDKLDPNKVLTTDNLNVDKLLTTDNCVSLGVDVHQMGRSWAVINIDTGDRHVIKFIDMKNEYAKDILQYLRKYEKAADINIDADPFTTKLFYEKLGW